MGLLFLLGLGVSHPLVLTVHTDHHLGMIRVLPYKLHLAVDLTVGLLFLLLPFALSFSGLGAAYYWLLAQRRRGGHCHRAV